MYVFKGSHSHSNMRSKVTAVSCLHSGVNDSAVHVTAVSMAHLCNQLCRLTLQIRSHIQKDLNPCIRGLGEMFDEEKKTRGRKSRVRVPLRN
jgi:hypothetical protein